VVLERRHGGAQRRIGKLHAAPPCSCATRKSVNSATVG
jgi:hypothetical protein